MILDFLDFCCNRNSSSSFVVSLFKDVMFVN